MTNAETGREISLKAHIAQSINNILFTRIGSRIMREDYGSILPDLIDMPLIPPVVLALQQAIVSAIAAWEPRVKIESVRFDAEAAAQGRLKIWLETVILSSGVKETFEITDV
ncbi:phage baseplate protein [Neisseria sp. N95_16]|uniref:Phage baseplate protein n=1 Tax=Neisseria brasiliensis TaxID=2666100 RepID=A0A5Q3RXV8_9NEIS|nr:MULTISPECIES: GPW/gp25 family protein [Neisseria]MRN37204.1 phage baseplate protein [Neisseria brasiliensis]PJO10078.1 phage baseplate protein [Neisseria sp. N95_16]PJO78741.1 phage baseplate protein [Neisseria sp. N177_16]QGL24213.1 phage baseplate protein [Neisseria brasiliensis]